jgi:chaperone BCS1
MAAKPVIPLVSSDTTNSTGLSPFANNHSREYGTAAIRIDDDDDLYDHFIAWISSQRMTEVSRDLKAATSTTRRRDEYNDDESDGDDDDVLDESGLFNYEKWSSNSPVRYEPNFGDDHFTHNGHYFEFTKEEKENKYNQNWDAYVIIRCYGRTTQPIKELITHVKEWSSTKESNLTSIYRSSRITTRHGGSNWEHQATRPSRPLDTVSLDEVQKRLVVGDINEYLHPATARWYAARGIPHRRGYLFYGAPGTGKTSLSFALAGIFGLSIYCTSLSEKEMTESELASLFSQLPRRCLVLLEDIDSAGIRRDETADDVDSDDESYADADPDEETEPKPVLKKKDTMSLSKRLSQITRTSTDTTSSETSSSGGFTKVLATASKKKAAKAAKAAKSAKALEDEKTTGGNISLAGLLNIIDGAASHEGRVLIMTTNYPEKLDSALIRPGRVDLQIKFTLATHDQIRAIFTRMYSTEHDMKKKSSPQHTCTTCACTNKAPGSTAIELSPERLAELADQFVKELPNITFSPAEIQGYLLMKKTDPIGAVAGVKQWREKVLEAKKKGKKVVDS